MKKILPVILSLFLVNTLLAQSNFSEIFPNNSKQNSLLNISEEINYKIYNTLFFEENNNEYKIQQITLDSNLATLENINIIWKKGPNDKITFLNAGIIQHVYTGFYSRIDEKKNTNELIAVRFGDNVGIETVIDSYEIKSISNTGAYQVAISPKGDAFAVLKEGFVEKNKQESADVFVFGPDLNKLNELSLTFSAASKPNPVNKIFATDKGDVYIIKKDREKTDYKFYVHAYNAELKGWNQKQITIPGKMISDIDACMNSSQEFIVAGFYNSFDVSSYEGYFYHRYDVSLKPLVRMNKRFTPEFMTDFIGKKAANKDDAVISGYYFENLLPGNNDEIFIVAEKEEFENINGRDRFSYQDILYMHFDKEGTIKNAGSLKNNQVTESDDGEWSSFNYAVIEDTLHFYHNEVEESATKSKFGASTFYGTYHSKVFRINKSTTVPATEMIKEGDEKFSFHPSLVYQTSDNHLLFLLMSKPKDKFVLGKVEIK